MSTQNAAFDWVMERVAFGEIPKDIEEVLVVALSTRPAESVAQCGTCNGHGMIGGHTGQTPETFDQWEAPCPECKPAAESVAQGGEALPDHLPVHVHLIREGEQIGTRCLDGGACHHSCTRTCFRKNGCVPLSIAESFLNDDWTLKTPTPATGSDSLGYVVLDDDGYEWHADDPIESGHCQYPQEPIMRMTADQFSRMFPATGSGGEASMAIKCVEAGIRAGERKYREALEFYARHEHWMQVSENAEASTLLVAGGPTGTLDGWSVAQTALEAHPAPAGGDAE